VLEERIVKGPWAASFGLLAASFVPWEMGWKSGGGRATHEVLKVGWVGKGKEKVKGTEGGKIFYTWGLDGILRQKNEAIDESWQPQTEREGGVEAERYWPAKK
jgi:hypothetical protein